MTPNTVVDLFRASGALLEGHFRLSSGLHSPGYLQCALVLQWPEHAAQLAEALAARVRDLAPSVVLSPALGGIVIGQEVAKALGVRAIFAERQDGALTLRRGFVLDPVDRVLVVEDVITTGGSTKETMNVAAARAAKVIGAAAIIDRHGSLDLGVPLVSLAHVAMPTYAAEDCPMCGRGLPVTKPGSRT
jgi:orotate phosphoribosyltransferase